MATWLVVGLGNPGPTYATHRHNVGAMTVDELARRCGGSWKADRLRKADVAEVRLPPIGSDSSRVILARTRTYMNESGIPVRNMLTRLKLTPDHLIVVHDEIDLDLGHLRCKFGGGDNGHNGLRSIRAMIGTGEYFRVRIGIGRPPGPIPVEKWVLTGFSKADQEELARMIDLAADAATSLLSSGLDATQQRFNS